MVREEKPEDISAIRKVNECAFNGLEERYLVDSLRKSNKAALSLVAVFNDTLVGHVLFSPVTFEVNPKNLQGLGLAPVAVLPEYQRRGIGSRLITQGLEECRKKGYAVVVVLGDQTFYKRFGFKRASRYGIYSKYSDEENFLVLDLHPEVLTSVGGVVKYQPEFN